MAHGLAVISSDTVGGLDWIVLPMAKTALSIVRTTAMSWPGICCNWPIRQGLMSALIDFVTK